MQICSALNKMKELFKTRSPARLGETPLYGVYVRPQRVWSLKVFGLKIGIDFDPVGLPVLF